MEPEQINTTPVETLPKQSHKIFYILIFIFIALVGVLSFWRYPSEILNFFGVKTPQLCIPDCGAFSHLVDETYNWKTYRNDKLGFEFKYPSELEVVGGGTDKVWRVGNPQRREMVDWMKLSIELISTETKDVNKFVSGYINNSKDYLGNSRKIIKTEQSNKGLHIEFEPIFGDFTFNLKPKENGNYYFIISSSTSYAVKFETINNFQSSKQFEQILSTFKFTSEKYKVLNDDFMGDGKLIEVNADGSEKVLIPSFRALAPSDSYRSFDKLSFPENSNILYFYSFLDESDAPPGGVYSYSLLTKEFKKLPNISEYYSNYGDKFLSPNGKYLASIVNPHQYSNKQIFLLDLENDKVTPIVTLSGKESITFCSVSGDCWDNQGDIKWINNNTIEYKIYDSSYFGEQTMYDYPEMDKRIFSF